MSRTRSRGDRLILANGSTGTARCFVVVGASGGLGRALSARLAERRHALVLLASDARDVAAEASHLQTTYGIAVKAIALDAASSNIADRVGEVVAGMGRLDGILFPIGLALEGDDGLLRGELLRRVLAVNLEVVLELSATFLPHLIEQRSGSIVGFGSIAAARGRARNAAYAAAKRGLRSYFESLACVTRGTGVEAQLYELGYVDTQQTLGKRLLLPAVSPDRIARDVVERLGSGSRIEYLPHYWRLVAKGARLLPVDVFCRLGF